MKPLNYNKYVFYRALTNKRPSFYLVPITLSVFRFVNISFNFFNATRRVNTNPSEIWDCDTIGMSTTGHFDNAIVTNGLKLVRQWDDKHLAVELSRAKVPEHRLFHTTLNKAGRRYCNSFFDTFEPTVCLSKVSDKWQLKKNAILSSGKSVKMSHILTDIFQPQPSLSLALDQHNLMANLQNQVSLL